MSWDIKKREQFDDVMKKSNKNSIFLGNVKYRKLFSVGTSISVDWNCQLDASY